MIFPEKIVKMFPFVSKHPDRLTLCVVLFGVLGLALMYVGFVR